MGKAGTVWQEPFTDFLKGHASILRGSCNGNSPKPGSLMEIIASVHVFDFVSLLLALFPLNW